MSEQKRLLAETCRIFRGDESDRDFGSGGERLAKAMTDFPPPPWRDPSKKIERGKNILLRPEDENMINAALLLRRPLLLTGDPGAGKTSLARAVAWQLGMEDVLIWPITSRSSLKEGIYEYDAIGRLQEHEQRKELKKNLDPKDAIRDYLRLGPLGTSFLGQYWRNEADTPALPRVLLIDELDKGDIDLPNDLLHVFEEGEYTIPELSRLLEPGEDLSIATCDDRVPGSEERPAVSIPGGRISCASFPLIIITSNGERQFPPAFLRRCLRHHLFPPNREELVEIVERHLGKKAGESGESVIGDFLGLRDGEQHLLSTDQLLNAVYLIAKGAEPRKAGRLEKAIFKSLDAPDVTEEEKQAHLRAGNDPGETTAGPKES